MRPPTDDSKEMRLYIASLEARARHLEAQLDAETSRRFRLIGGVEYLVREAMKAQMHPRSRASMMLQQALDLLATDAALKPLAKVIPNQGHR